MRSNEFNCIDCGAKAEVHLVLVQDENCSDVSKEPYLGDSFCWGCLLDRHPNREWLLMAIGVVR